MDQKPAKIHLLVDERGAPLAVWITGANEHDKWSVDDLIVHIAVKRPNSEQHFCADKGYDYEDLHEFVGLMNYIEHIKHRRRRNEPKDEYPVPGEKSFPARRWMVERTFGWQSAEVLPHARAKSHKTDLLLFTWLALKSFLI